MLCQHVFGYNLSTRISLIAGKPYVNVFIIHTKIDYTGAQMEILRNRGKQQMNVIHE